MPALGFGACMATTCSFFGWSPGGSCNSAGRTARLIWSSALTSKLTLVGLRLGREGARPNRNAGPPKPLEEKARERRHNGASSLRLRAEMYLEYVALKGFRSFKDRTEVRLNEGITFLA